MELTVHTSWVPKDGHDQSEYEDAFAFYGHNTSHKAEPRNRPPCRIAVADGATDSWCSGLWASLLVESASLGQLQRNKFQQRFEALRKQWLELSRPKESDWVKEEKSRGGAHAAIVSVSINTPRSGEAEGQWSAWAIGDCCLFHLRAGQLLCSFPYERPDQFTSTPQLLATAAASNDVTALIKPATGAWQSGDEIVLASDALAQWCLEHVDEHGRYDERVLAAATQPQPRARFAEWVADERRAGRLRNDDTTLVSLRTG